MAITDLDLVPYGNAHVLTRDPPTFRCQHGDEECYGNWVELCAQKYNPANWWNFILCEEASEQFDDEGVKKCAEQAGINAEEILTCAHGTEGPLLHLEAADKTPADHKWVPWVVVDGVHDEYVENLILNDMLDYLCSLPQSKCKDDYMLRTPSNFLGMENVSKCYIKDNE